MKTSKGQPTKSAAQVKTEVELSAPRGTQQKRAATSTGVRAGSRADQILGHHYYGRR